MSTFIFLVFFVAQSWKHPILLSGHEDHNFMRAFTARREKNEVPTSSISRTIVDLDCNLKLIRILWQRSKLDVMLHITLTEVSVHRKAESSVDKGIVDTFNHELADIYKYVPEYLYAHTRAHLQERVYALVCAFPLLSRSPFCPHNWWSQPT